MSQRKRRDGRFKAQVALEAITNHQNISPIASEYGVNPSIERIASDELSEQIKRVGSDPKSIEFPVRKKSP